ncbi:MAG: M56 family metallopeptidase [Acidobacteria bacterium]|nr:M56 family metallopeptidase [Acidobacteriota bacterium]
MIDILLEASLRSLVVGAAAWFLLHALRVRSGATRHAAYTAVLLAMLASPLMVVWRPALPLYLPHATLPVTTLSVPVGPTVVVSPSVASREPARSTIVGSPAAREAPAPRSSADTAVPAGLGRSRSWSGIALVVWLTGVLAGAFHLALGWHRLRRFASSCVPVESARLRSLTTAIVAESPAAITPVVFGIRRPVVVLPVSWPSWTDEDLRAAVVHEAAHVRRRDTLVALVARINRTVFWFHPLAWGLERALASSAEQACDDAVVREWGDERAYADLLVRLASSVSGAQGRVAWQAIGIAGRGSLETRVDRLLTGAARAPLSRRRVAALAVGCAAAITAGMACQQRPEPLRPDPEREAAWQARETQMREWQTAASMTVEQVEAMEARATADPTDIDTASALLTFYQRRGQREFGWNAMIERRRPHLIRLVQHHPETAARRLIPSHDPEGYAQVRALWMAHVSSADASTAVLANAASFFSVSEKPLAEELLLRAQKLDADGPQPRRRDGVYYPSWAERLGELYALAIVGSNDAFEGNVVVVRGVDPDAARGPFAAHARAALETTDNPTILTAAGRVLTSSTPNIDLTQALGFDVAAVGRTYLERALALDPDLEAPRMLLINEDIGRRHERVSAFLRSAGTEPDDALAALPETERLEMFADVTSFSYIGTGGVLSPREEETQGWQRARRLAEAALQLAARHPTHPSIGLVTYNAHVVLGTFAIREGDRRTALAHLRGAAASPGSEELMWMPTVGHLGLVHALLDAGEYEVVASYFDRLAELNRVGATRWREDARAIREGRMPESYQRAKRGAVVLSVSR